MKARKNLIVVGDRVLIEPHSAIPALVRTEIDDLPGR